MQENERMRKKRQDAENALFPSKRDQEEAKMQSDAKLKKKKKKKEWVHKEVNYWLDYESPYAEYLPALYREYKPKEAKEGQAVSRQGDRIK
jgi:hypothetical protein